MRPFSGSRFSSSLILYFVKGYLPYKTVCYNEVALDVMIFLIRRKNVKSTDFKICDVIISIST